MVFWDTLWAIKSAYRVRSLSYAHFSQIVLKYALNLAPRPIQCLRSNEKFWGRIIHKRCLWQSRQFSFEVTLASRRRAIHRINTIFTTNSRVNKEVITVVRNRRPMFECPQFSELFLKLIHNFLSNISPEMCSNHL